MGGCQLGWDKVWGVALVGLGVVIMISFGWLEAEAALEDMPGSAVQRRRAFYVP